MLLITIVMAPLFSSLVILLFGRWLGYWGYVIITTTCLLLPFVISCGAVYLVALPGLELAWDCGVLLGFREGTWILFLDPTSSVHCCIISFISFSACIFLIRTADDLDELWLFLFLLSLISSMAQFCALFLM